MAVDPPMRASDGDRDRVVEILREEVAQGRLTFEEFEDRVGRAYTATTWDDLRQLVNDLPVQVTFAGERPGRAPASTGRPRQVGRYELRQQWLVPAVVCGLVAAVLIGAWEVSPYILLGVFWFAFGSCGRRRASACGTRPTRVTPPRYR